MPTASTNRPTKTNRPTRSSVHVNCLRIAIDAVPPPRLTAGIPIQLRIRVTTAGATTTEKQSTASSHKIALEIRVFCRCDLLRRTVEINAALVVNDKARDGFVLIGLDAR